MIKKLFIILACCSSVLAESSADWVAKSMESAKAGKMAEAETHASKAIEADAVNWQAYYLRAQIRSRLGRHAESAEDLTRLLNHNPAQPNLNNLRGMEYFRAGQMEKAIADFDKYIAAKPAEAAHHWQRGIAYYYAGKFKEGKKQFESHQTVNANDVENAVWHFICTAKAEGFDKARQQLIPITGDSRVPMKEVQDLFAGTGTTEKVMEAARAGAPAESELKNRIFFAHLYLGLFHESKGEMEKAAAHIREAATTYAQEHYMGDVAKVHWKQINAKNAK